MKSITIKAHKKNVWGQQIRCLSIADGATAARLVSLLRRKSISLQDIDNLKVLGVKVLTENR